MRILLSLALLLTGCTESVLSVISQEPTVSPVSTETYLCPIGHTLTDSVNVDSALVAYCEGSPALVVYFWSQYYCDTSIVPSSHCSGGGTMYLEDGSVYGSW